MCTGFYNQNARGASENHQLFIHKCLGYWYGLVESTS